MLGSVRARKLKLLIFWTLIFSVFLARGIRTLGCFNDKSTSKLSLECSVTPCCNRLAVAYGFPKPLCGDLSKMSYVLHLVIGMPELVEAKLPEAHVLEGAIGVFPRLQPVRAGVAHNEKNEGHEAADGPVEKDI